MSMQRKDQILQNIKAVEKYFNRDHRPVLIHVTKTRPVEDIMAAYELGVRDFGENRIEELKQKSDFLLGLGITDIRWHFIGNIQTKKINRLFKIPGLFALHSVDSLKLLKSLVEREGNLLSAQLYFFIQINTSGEQEKSGITGEDELGAITNYCMGLEQSKLKWHGLMTMGKLRSDDFEEDARKCFSKLSSIKETLSKDFGLSALKLSMGMSSDFKIALQEGSDYLRLGGLLYR